MSYLFNKQKVFFKVNAKCTILIEKKTLIFKIPKV